MHYGLVAPKAKAYCMLGIFLTVVQTFFGCQVQEYHCPMSHSHLDSVIGSYEERDLELFYSSDHSQKGFFLKKLDRTRTSFGHTQLIAHLKNPITDIALLHARQQQLLLLDDQALLHRVQSRLAAIAQYEKSLMYFIECQEDALVARTLENFYFQSHWLKNLNSSSLALDTRNYIKYLGLFGPVAEHLTFHYAVEWVQAKTVNSSAISGHACSHDNDHHHHHGHGCIHDLEPSHNASLYIKNIFRVLKAGHFLIHALGIKEMVDQKVAEHALMEALHQRVVEARLCLLAIRDVCRVMKEANYDPQAFGLPGEWPGYFDAPLFEQQSILMHFLEDKSFDSDSSLSHFSRIGATLSSYQLLKSQLPLLQSLTTSLGNIDALTAIAQWYQHVNIQGKRACLVDFNSASASPLIRMKNFWHLAFDPAQAIANTIDLSVHNRLHCIITGPNKAGKSCILKAVGLNIILAQTFGVAAAEYVCITPFSKLISHITIVDDAAHGTSTMAAEMIRVDYCLQALWRLQEHQFACVLVDDSLFKGTTAEKSVELAQHFISSFGATPGCCSMVATHMPTLTALQEAPNSSFKNYCIHALRDYEGKARSTFLLVEGIADPRSVLDIVRSEKHTI